MDIDYSFLINKSTYLYMSLTKKHLEQNVIGLADICFGVYF